MSIGNHITDAATHLVEAAVIHRKSAARREARREIRRTIAKAVQRHQFADSEQKMTQALVPFFAKQIRSAARELGQFKDFDLETKQSDAAVNLAKMIYNPREWDRELINRTLPLVVEGMVEGAVSTLAQVGVELRKSASNGRKPKGYNIPVDTPIGRYRAVYGAETGDKASTASEWLDSIGVDPPPGVSTEYPEWFQREISSATKETFEQDYWEGINDSTLQDLEKYIDKGLKDGWSISKMSANMTSIMGPEYYKGRSTNIARTESGNALNAGRNASIAGVQQAVGPEAAQEIGKGWLSVLGNTTRDTHAIADGQLADPQTGMFNLAGYIVPWPSHHSLPPGERCNCQCTITMELGVGMPEAELQAALSRVEEKPFGGLEDKLAKNPVLNKVRASVLKAQDTMSKDLARLSDEKGLVSEELGKINSEWGNAWDRRASEEISQEVFDDLNKTLSDRALLLERKMKQIDKQADVIIFRKRQSVEKALWLNPKDRVKVKTRKPAGKEPRIYLGKNKRTLKTFGREYDDKMASASQFVGGITKQSGGLSEIVVNTHSLPKGSRAFHSGGSTNTSGVFLAKKNGTSTFVHELGHRVEEVIPDARKRANEFRSMRIARAGTTNVKMQDAVPNGRYKADEIGNKDEWEKAFGNNHAHYVGKKYESGHTEVISMGLQKMYENPIGFAEDDPEFFKFIIGITRGEL